jgi:hypothetical protein
MAGHHTYAAFAVMGLFIALGRPSAASGDDDARRFLAATLSLDADDLKRVDAGEVVTRTLTASDSREVATLGIVRMRVTPDFYVARLADIVNFKRADAVLQIGVFGTPPAAADVAALTLDASDLRNLRECRVGRCGVQLPAEAIDRFEREVNWQRAGAADRANALMRQFLVEYVTRYQQTGPAAWMQYADQASTLDLRQEFASLARSDLGGWDRFPSLRSHLLQYPDTPASDTHDVLYWSKEKTGRRSVASITHLAIARTAGESPAEYAIASKQIYGTHYYDASLGLTMLLPDRTSATPKMYVAYLNRSRIDIFTGVLGKVARKLVTSKARTTVSDQLAQLQRTLEPQFGAAPTPR